MNCQRCITAFVAVAMCASAGVLEAQRSYEGTVFSQVGTAAPSSVKHMAGDVFGFWTVERDAPGNDGVEHKKLGNAFTRNEIRLTYNDVTTDLLELLDAFLEGRRVAMDVIFGDNYRKEAARMHSAGVQVTSIRALVDMDYKECQFVVTLVGAWLPSTSPATQGQTIAPLTNAACERGVRLSVDGVQVPWMTRVDSLEWRGNWIKGEVGTGFRFPNLRVSMPRMKDDTAMSAWFDRQVLGGSAANHRKRSLTVEFAGPLTRRTLPPLLSLEAHGVGMVAKRWTTHRQDPNAVPAKETDETEFELYVERWDRTGRVPHAAAPPKNPSTGAPAESGNNAAAPGAFRVQLPAFTFSGVGSTCTDLDATTTLLVKLNGDDGSGLIVANGPKLRVGTFDVALEGDNTIQMAINRTGGGAYAAKRGSLTITKAGAQTSGTFRVFADVFDPSGDVKEISISGSFTDLPRKC